MELIVSWWTKAKWNETIETNPQSRRSVIAIDQCETKAIRFRQ